MKRNLLSAIATVVAALTFAGAAYGQYKAAGGDGIAASPKVRQMLSERHATVTSTTAAAPAMACPKCADVQTAKASPQAKGAEVLDGAKQISYTHACTGCDTKLSVAGEGKAKQQVAAHTCTAETGSNLACCATK